MKYNSSEFQKLLSKSSTNIKHLQQFRKHFADECEKCSDKKLHKQYEGYFAPVLRDFLNAELHAYPLSKIDKAFAQQALKIWKKSPQVNGRLLVLMLYFPPYVLPLRTWFSLNLPPWFINDFFWYLLKPPRLLQKTGDADRYYAYITELLNLLFSNAQQDPNNSLWQQLSQFVANEVSLSMMYFMPASSNPLSVLRARSALLQFSAQLKGWQLAWQPPLYQAHEKVRVGVLAKHFAPGTETFSSLPLFEFLDKTYFEVFLYALQNQNSLLETYCQQKAEKFLVLPEDVPQAVQQIRNDNLDIMLLGTNVTASGKGGTPLALHRLARLQITNFASPVSTCFPYVDYYLSGTLLEDEAAQTRYTEKLLRLDGAGYCFTYNSLSPLAEQPIVPGRTDWKVDDDIIVFMSGAFVLKIIPEVREVWAKILATVPNSILVLYPFAPSWLDGAERLAQAFIQQMQLVCKQHKVSTERLHVLDPLPGQHAVHTCLQAADIYLDSFPYSGSHSTVDALLSHVPPVVMRGDCVRFNQAAALLLDLEIPDLIANDEQTYVNLAVSLAQDQQKREHLNQKIAEKMLNKPRFLDSQHYGALLSQTLLDLVKK